jgi:PPIC-type PPIASE domain
VIRSIAALAAVALTAGVVWAKGSGGGYVVVVPGGPPPQPGDACIAEGVASGREAKTADGTVVLVKSVHGINTSRCSDPAFPLLATTQKVEAEAIRNAPSIQCVPQGARVGDEVTIEFYGLATVLEVLPGSTLCRVGRQASVISSAAYRASKAAQAPEAATSQPAAPREPTEAEIQNEYDRLFAAFAPIKEFRVRHILVRTREEADAALQEIRSGKSFADVAAKVSLDPGSRAKGGDLGWNGASAFIEEFSKTMVSLEPAGLAPEPTRTRFGWHVIEVLETKIGKDSFPPLPAVKDRIAAKLKVAKAASVRVPARAVCRKMAPPEVPVAASREGTKGTVVAEMRVENGKVVEVLSLSGPSVFHPAVTEALNKYECDRLDRPVLATQSFDF